MFKMIQNLSLCTTLAVIVVFSSGCAALVVGAAAGAGGVTFAKGKLVKNLDAPVKKVHKATLGAAKKLNIFIKSDELNKHSAKIKGEDSEGKNVAINIKALTELASTISIRFGIIGDDVKSSKLLAEIERRI